MARVLLQKQAEPAVSFLPQWLSGYAFLFDMESNLEQAKELRGKLPASVAGGGQPVGGGGGANKEKGEMVVGGGGGGGGRGGVAPPNAKGNAARPGGSGGP